MTVAKFVGVYSSTRNPGAHGQSSVSRKRHWFVWEDSVGQYRVQLLDAAFQPLDEPCLVARDEFHTIFEHEPHILVTPVRQLEIATPEDAEAGILDDLMSALPGAASREAEVHERNERSSIRRWEEPAPEKNRAVRQPAAEPSVAEEPIVKGPVLGKAALAAEMEKAEELDRELRTEFALALTRWRRGGQQAALRVFEKLAARKEGLIPAHKHMFTDFGIDLRKSKLITLAVRHFIKAVELAPEDDNVHFNLARIYYEIGDIDKARKELEVTLELAPHMRFALQFQEFLDLKYPEHPSAASRKGDIFQKKSSDGRR